MIKMILACNAGMSTSILKFRLMNEFKRHGYQVLLAAVPISELDDYIADSHIILLAPQVRFFEKELKKSISLPIYVIDIADYGRMDATKIFSEIKEYLSKI